MRMVYQKGKIRARDAERFLRFASRMTKVNASDQLPICRLRRSKPRERYAASGNEDGGQP
jgi:hypothetical protein